MFNGWKITNILTDILLKTNSRKSKRPGEEEAPPASARPDLLALMRQVESF